jgi:NAD(P)-dependent dehydrogenase (short-subunit alcohol dehydrogenase family)
MPLSARYPSLTGVPVVISGGATGIGAVLVRAFADQGASVGFVDINAEAGAELAAELVAQKVSFIPCDVTDIAAYRAAITEFSTMHGPAAVLINNAAHDERHDWSRVTPEEWDARINTNLRHAFFAIQAVAPGMIEAGRGSIINLGSISWMIMVPRLPLYQTAKAAMHGLTRSMARELGRHRIRVNTLVPGWVMTERQLEHWVDDEAEALIDNNQALQDRVLPADIAAMALFLAAEDSAMISGQHFTVDGGWANT